MPSTPTPDRRRFSAAGFPQPTFSPDPLTTPAKDPLQTPRRFGSAYARENNAQPLNNGNAGFPQQSPAPNSANFPQQSPAFPQQSPASSAHNFAHPTPTPRRFDNSFVQSTPRRVNRTNLNTSFDQTPLSVQQTPLRNPMSSSRRLIDQTPLSVSKSGNQNGLCHNAGGTGDGCRGLGAPVATEVQTAERVSLEKFYKSLEGKNLVEKVHLSMKRNKQASAIYIGTLAAIGLLWFLLSSGDFSFMMTLSVMISFASFVGLLAFTEMTKSMDGISLRMLECYCFVQAARIVAVLPFDGYVPYDRTGDWFYRTVELLTLCIIIGLVVRCKTEYNATCDPANDTFPIHYIIGPAAVLGLIFHPDLNEWNPSNQSWAFALYLESVAMLPQIRLFTKQQQVQPVAAHFLVAQTVAKFVSLMFWLHSAIEPSWEHFYNPCAGWVLFVQLVQVLVSVDFVYEYLKCLQSSGKGVERIMENYV